MTWYMRTGTGRRDGATWTTGATGTGPLATCSGIPAAVAPGGDPDPPLPQPASAVTAATRARTAAGRDTRPTVPVTRVARGRSGGARGIPLGGARRVAQHELALQVARLGLAGIGLAADPVAVGAQVPCVRVVGERARQRVEQVVAQHRGLGRRHGPPAGGEG